jgi:hypothetical protein
LPPAPPQFQVISLITTFLSVLVSTIYITLYAPLERIALITLAFRLYGVAKPAKPIDFKFINSANFLLSHPSP